MEDIGMDSRELCLEQTLLILSERGLKFTMSELASQLGMSKVCVKLFSESFSKVLNPFLHLSNWAACCSIQWDSRTRDDMLVVLAFL